MKTLHLTMMTTEIQSKEQMVLTRLSKFYSDPEVFERVRKIVCSESPISLRLLDWLATNYAKKHNISYLTREGRHVIVYLAYKSNLRAYTKKMFDPFCRYKKIHFQGMTTTVGQLSFFQWAIDDEVLDYLEAHCEEVQQDMDECSAVLVPAEGGRRKRHELSRSATKTVCHHTVKIPVKFD